MVRAENSRLMSSVTLEELWRDGENNSHNLSYLGLFLEIFTGYLQENSLIK